MIDKNTEELNCLVDDIINLFAFQQDSAKIIKIAGSVAVGKTTFAKKLASFLKLKMPNANIVTISTDHFLNTNSVIEKTCGLNKKGFPESFNQELLTEFFASYVDKRVLMPLPIYSHQAYDILPNKLQQHNYPDILIIEGVIALNKTCIDIDGVGVFLEASLDVVRSWYEHRFLQLCSSVDKTSFFLNFNDLSESELLDKINKVWQGINEPNWFAHIQATKLEADFIVHKQQDHSWNYTYKGNKDD